VLAAQILYLALLQQVAAVAVAVFLVPLMAV
jgi:hypothetical protein